MTTSLVTGGAGFIGSHLCDSLVARGDEVVVIDDFSLGRRENLAQLGGQIRLIEDSILNIKDHANVVAECDRVYHMAALISGYDSLLEPEPYMETNMHGLLRLIDVVKDLDQCRLIFASSSTVYGNQADPVYRETDPANPPTVYALTKLSGEQTLAMYNEMYGIDYVCLRLFNVYGPRQNPDHPYANVTCKFSHAAATDGQIKLFGDGEQSRDFVYVDDVVRAFLAVSEHSEFPVYNVGTGQVTSINQLIDVFGDITGSPLEIQQCPPWPNDIRTIEADISRISDEFDFRPQVSLHDGLKQTVGFFRR